MTERENTVRRWFGMWLNADCNGIEEIFSHDAVYIESWGPEYHGLEKIRLWFEEWNSRGRVRQWDIKQFFHREDQTAVEWFFRNEMYSGAVESFDGVSLLRWDGEGKIRFLQEFGCNTRRYDPYAGGGAPRFEDEPSRWF